ncbi:hypothetical protein SORBI_3009G139700 [Sorghum bicolor]|uniref:Uncharacterized protein n=1 Tax=Sorghum bicolor TaxID=4558 RepID=A0A1Z5R2K6_SORBI|nr:hypothetical protein SORBI_3009G139700 [Sorghum bicolor]
MAEERKQAGSRWPAGGSGGGRMRDAEGGSGKMRGRQATKGYFTAGLAALFLCLTALLVFLPLVLPPLPPPPYLLLLVPVGLMAVLLALVALVPSDGRAATAAVASSCVC